LNELTEVLTKLQDSQSYLLEERKADLSEISELLKASAHTTITEVFKRTEEDLAKTV
jgi:hypothetical protein